MWDEVIIGSGNKGNSAYTLRGLKQNILGRVCSISQNKISYWVNGAFLDVSMTIFKDTDAGKKLAELLSVSDNDDEIMSLLDTLVLKNIDPEILKSKIEIELKHAMEQGRRVQAAVIRESLNYGNYGEY